MKAPIRFVLAGLGLAFVGGTAHGQLTGTVHGEFTPLASGDRGFDFTTVSNTATDSWFNSGSPADSGGQTQLHLMDSSFADVGSGGTLAQNFVALHNGNEYLGTTADHAMFDLKLDLPSMGVMNHTLTTVWCDISNTANFGASGTPDSYLLSFAPPPAPLEVGNMRLMFHLSFPDFDVAPGTAIDEHGNGMTGLLTVDFVPIPEPGTYALAGMAVIGLAVLLRRRHRLPPVQAA